ncbi:MAG TPA: alginate export family protein, partial [Spongiibacteraceae bacterium]
MPKKTEYWGLVCAVALVLPNAANAADAFTDALTGGKVTGNFRLRYEDVNVHTDGLPAAAKLKDATALTLRSRLGYETAPFNGFTALLEFEDIHVVGGKDSYTPEFKNSAKPASSPYDYAAIVDPERTEINRAYLRYRGVPKLDLGLGRQRITLDNQRFVGPSAWRQDEQTFDAFTANYAGVADWNFYYAYINKVNGIASVKPTYNYDLDTSDNLFNITYSGFVLGKITAYGYFLDNQQPDTELRNVAPDVNALNPSLRYKSNDTYGLRFDGNYILPTTMPLRLFYTAEYAKQKLVNPTDVDFHSNYSLLEGGVGYMAKLGLVSAKVAQEVLGSDTKNGFMRGFQTPYATKHIFNGWVDMFLNTPDGGLKDRYATLAADLQPYGVKLMAMYHKYSEVDGPITGGGARDFGTEW